MNRRTLYLCAVLLVAAVAVVGCSQKEESALPETASSEPIQGTPYSKITLEDVAYQSLGIKTQPVRQETVAVAIAATGTVATGTAQPAAAAGRRRLVIPTSALVFDPKGDPYVYTSPAPKTYVRAALVIDRYRGNDVILIKGPPVGTQVVTVGDPELLGIEYGVGSE
jgi:hypothetical protein